MGGDHPCFAGRSSRPRRRRRCGGEAVPVIFAVSPMALSKVPQPVYVMAMERADIDAVMEIERLSFPLPWSREAIVEELARAWARIDVVRDAVTSAIAAFANYWLVADELHILNIATHPESRR